MSAPEIAAPKYYQIVIHAGTEEGSRVVKLCPELSSYIVDNYEAFSKAGLLRESKIKNPGTVYVKASALSTEVRNHGLDTDVLAELRSVIMTAGQDFREVGFPAEKDLEFDFGKEDPASLVAFPKSSAPHARTGIGDRT